MIVISVFDNSEQRFENILMMVNSVFRGPLFSQQETGWSLFSQVCTLKQQSDISYKIFLFYQALNSRTQFDFIGGCFLG